MTDQNIKKIIGDKRLILDFDGVITQLEINWELVRTKLTEMLKVSELNDLQRLYLYAQAKNKKEVYLELLREEEAKGINKNKKSDIFTYVVRNKIPFAICSNNTKSTIKSFLDNNNCQDSKIIAIDDVRFIKPNPEGLIKIIQHNNPNDFLFIGDFINDEIAAGLIQLPFVYYDFQSST